MGHKRKSKTRIGSIPKPFHWGPKQGVAAKRNKAQRKGSRKKIA